MGASMILLLQLTSLSLTDGFWVSNARVEANAGIDFLDCILQLVEGGFLVAGDILVMDNASIRDSAEICAHVAVCWRSPCVLTDLQPRTEPM